MRRMKTRASRSRPVAASSSSSENIISLGASQEEAPTPPTPSTDVASSSTGSQRRCGVPLKWNQFTRKHEDVNHYESKAPHPKMAHPWPDHLYPLHVAMGAAGDDAEAKLVHRSWTKG
nr:uncharacterized protein LOC118059353 [Populus alba]